jgi:Tfp pilus assembly protein PilN
MKATRLRLEFAPNARHVSWLGATMLIVSIVVLVAGAAQFAKVLANNARQADTLQALGARRGATATSATRTTPPEPGEVARARAVRSMAQTLVTPWADLLESLESAPNQSVALLSIEPSVAKHSMRLTAEARNPKDMLAYLSALQRDTRLFTVVLVSHQIQAQSPGSPVRFQIQAGWGAGP